MPENDHIVNIGTRQIWGGEQPLCFGRADRRHHLYAIGQTGSGKTTLLRNLILQDIASGRGVGLIDPHGDLAHEILDCIPRHRSRDVVYFNPADDEFPPALNLFANVDPRQRHLVASGIVSTFKSIWRDSWGPRLEYILYTAVATLLEVENTTLLGIQRLLTDPDYRNAILLRVKDPMIRKFWQVEFAGYDQRFLAEVIAPVQNKVGQLLMAPPIRNILGQAKSKIDPRFMMDNRRIFIANLAKGRIGEDKANLLGAVLVSQFQIAAMGRATIPEKKRQDFYLYIDEFHNFSTDSFASILSEARKYRLCLTLSHQHVDQLDEKIQKAVFGNVGSLIAFRVGEVDGDRLVRHLGGDYTGRSLSDLDNYQICARLLTDGRNNGPFLDKTLPPIQQRHGHRPNLIRQSRKRFATPRTQVEDKINRWLKLI
jgi:hypothetical protein